MVRICRQLQQNHQVNRKSGSAAEPIGERCRVEGYEKVRGFALRVRSWPVAARPWSCLTVETGRIGIRPRGRGGFCTCIFVKTAMIRLTTTTEPTVKFGMIRTSVTF